MKNKRFAVILLLAVLAVLFVLPASASTYAEETLLLDRADLLSDAEETQLRSRIVDFIQSTDCHLTVLTDTVRYDDDNQPSILPSLSANDLVLLTVSRVGGQYYYYLYTYGRADRNLTDSEVDDILDHSAVYNNLKSGQIYDGISAFAEITEKRINSDFFIEPSDIVIAALVAVAVAGISCGIVAARYKMKLKPTNYPLDRFAKMELTEKSDIFTGSFVTKRRISTSSGGGSHSGRSGGGRSGGGRGGR